MSDTQAQEAAMPVIAYLRASKDGMPQWTEDCVCEDPVYPSDPDGSDEDCISMPMVRKADADAVIASQAARIAELEKAIERMTNNRDMWKGQCERQAAELARMREPLSDERIEQLASLLKPITQTNHPSWEHAVCRVYEKARGIQGKEC